jgi:small subunit ribosomal protein S5e
VIKQCFEVIALLTGRNPLAVFVTAVINGGAREDFTKISAGGLVR